MLLAVFLSLVFALVASALVVAAIIYIPADYFTVQKEKKRHPLWHYFLKFLRNLLGVVLVGMGVTLLVLPGPGIFSILLGTVLIDFPGKRRMIRRLLSIPALYRTLNLIRHKAGKPPLRLPPRIG